MNPKSILVRADKVVDPLGIVVVVVAYFANKYWSLGLTADEVLLASLGMGAMRTLWEGHKRTWREPPEKKDVEAAPDPD